MGKARDYIPSLKLGHRIHPEDIAGMIGKPHVGDIFYVDTTNGSDTANAGKSWDDAFAKFSKAEDSVTSGNHDVIVLAPGAQAASSETAAITFDKNHVTVIGNVSPIMISQRARILAGSSVSPLLTVSGYGNTFINVQFATYNDNNGLVNITGDRNAFFNVHFAGMGNATTGDDTAAYDVQLDGSMENYFDHCTFGLDTIARSAANRSLYLDGGSGRNIFEDCLFNIYVDATTPVFVEAADASAVDRFHLFKRCTFISFSVNETVVQAEAFKIPASPMTHRYILQDCALIQTTPGSADWDSNNRGDIWANMPAPAASAAGGIATSQ